MVEEADKAGVNVLIGHENTVGKMNDSTIIFRTIRVDGVDIGAIGIIGPVRMDYEKVISTINSLTESVSEMMRSARQSLPEAKPLGLDTPKVTPPGDDSET